MSNQFSYELDERQIRIMLRDGEMENDPAAWNRYEQMAQPDAKPKQASFSPRFNLSISRSVLVPLVFVVLIGGLSATLFSFVDFKKKEVKVSNAVPEQKKPETPAVKQTQPATSVSNTPEKAAGTSAETITAAPTPTVQQPALTQQAVQKTETKPAEAAPVKATTSRQAVTATSASPALTAATTNTNQQPIVKKKKQKKVVSEEIPTINASSTNLNQESQEPELELR